MAHNSLFAILLRSRWWVSFLIAAATALLARLLLPKDYQWLAVFSALPFIVIGAIAAWKQLQQPSPARVQETLQAMGAMPWAKFADTLEQAFRADGQEVTRLPGPKADFQLTRAGSLTLVSGRRWKAARTGVEPLRELQAAMAASGAASGLYVALGEPSDAAIAFARENGIQILRGNDLARLMRR
ncbi:restriction endonuclease [Aquincola sp. S2]|uniref:Restriction endonuclease n=2 Tax=Pseudaquabacterium terrae TaxID=2732868 RepID=A0ABX2EFA1_9BURK|nr:restriction endonuclease [Aquabacterium terrae]NRF67283.1 restriction endonuclease [Aquabacterium terrae]